MKFSSVQIIFVFLTTSLVSGFVYLERDTLFELFRRSDVTLELSSDIVQDTFIDVSTSALEIVHEVITDTPLRGPIKEIFTEVELTSAGILGWTNIHRASSGLPPLSMNPRLSAAAVLKVQDMFLQQYFAHDSPQGTGAGDLAEKTGYGYILIGENLALGNYENDQVLVQAWMDSPGHRENILNDRFTEIGIAVIEGTFEGQTVWMAVQEFGLPLSACDSPSEYIANNIDENKEEIDDLGLEIEDFLGILEDVENSYGSTYNKNVRKYNDLIEMYNDLVKETKLLVDQYNLQVQQFNTCASG